MTTTLQNNFVARMKELENAAVRAIDDLQAKYVLDGTAPDDDLVFRLCKEGNMTFEEYERRLALKREIPNRIANGLTQWDKADKARSIAKAVSAHKTKTDEIIDGLHKELRQLQKQYNVATSEAQEAREDAHWALRNVSSPRLRELQDAAHNAISETKSLEADLSRLALEMRYTEEIVKRGLFANGGQASPKDVERAKEDLQEFTKDRREKAYRLELLKLQIPVMYDNCMRAAIGANEVPLPIDFKYSEIGSVVAVYESEQSDEPTVAPTPTTTAPEQTVAPSSSPATSAPTRTRAKQVPAPMASDLDLI
jgi:hypothetical protein